MGGAGFEREAAERTSKRRLTAPSSSSRVDKLEVRGFRLRQWRLDDGSRNRRSWCRVEKVEKVEEVEVDGEKRGPSCRYSKKRRGAVSVVRRYERGFVDDEEGSLDGSGRR